MHETRLEYGGNSPNSDNARSIGQELIVEVDGNGERRLKNVTSSGDGKCHYGLDYLDDRKEAKYTHSIESVDSLERTNRVRNNSRDIQPRSTCRFSFGKSPFYRAVRSLSVSFFRPRTHRICDFLIKFHAYKRSSLSAGSRQRRTEFNFAQNQFKYNIRSANGEPRRDGTTRGVNSRERK